VELEDVEAAGNAKCYRQETDEKGPRRKAVGRQDIFTSTETWSDQHGVGEASLECNTPRTDPSEGRLKADRDGERVEKRWLQLAAGCEQRGFRNAARSGGHNIFPTGPEVVVRPARPPSLDCPNIDHLVSRTFDRILLSLTDGREASCIKDKSFSLGRAAAMQQNSAHTSRIRR
jgi:hypothetical protein